MAGSDRHSAVLRRCGVLGGDGVVDLLTKHAPMVRRLAGQLKARLPAHIDRNDLMQVGMIALWQAAPKFDSAHGASFEAYISCRVRGAMLDELRRQDWLPRDARATCRRVADAQARAEQAHGRPGRDSEVAEILGVSLSEYRALLRDVAVEMIPLEDHDDAGQALCPSQALQERQDLDVALAAMPNRLRAVMLRVMAGEQQQEIAADLGVTPSRVCQMLHEARPTLASAAHVATPLPPTSLRVTAGTLWG